MTDDDPSIVVRTAGDRVAVRDAIVASGGPVLALRGADGALLVVPLDASRGQLTIGREPGSDIQLEWDLTVSRLHAVIECVGGAWFLVDESFSANGSFVNRERVRRQRLVDADVIKVGATEALVRMPVEASRPASTVMVDPRSRPEISPREFEVLLALCRPQVIERLPFPASNPQIAKAIHLSEDAVKTHLRNLFAKFGLDGLAQNEKRIALAQRAVEVGAVDAAAYRVSGPAGT